MRARNYGYILIVSMLLVCPGVDGNMQNKVDTDFQCVCSVVCTLDYVFLSKP